MYGIDPPLDPVLVRKMTEYAAEEHTPEREPEAPDAHCPWAPSADGAQLVHLGAHANRTDAAWVDYLDALFFKPTSRRLYIR